MTREQAIKEIYGIPANKKQHEALQILIPELKESEGERVRKALIDLVCTVGEYYLKPDSRNRMLAWLENQKPSFKQINDGDIWHNGLRTGIELGKQKEQESAEWGKLQEDFRNINEAFENGKKEVVDNPEKYGLCRHEEWSEEDEHRRDGIIQWLREYQWQFNPKYDSLSIESIESLIDWFKSIRPSWKPTEEQMGALDYAYGELFKRGDVGHNILGPLQKLCDECRRRIKELSKQIKKS